MRQMLRDLEIEEFIVHAVPSKIAKRILREAPETKENHPVFSTMPSTISSESSRFFYDKITSTIGSTDSIDIVFMDDSPVKGLIGEYFSCDSSRRIAITQEIARHLYNKQDAKNSGGLILFILGIVGGNKNISILKLEQEDGVRVTQEITDGLTTFSIDVITDLMLTRRTKLFKIVTFYHRDSFLKGILCDKQRGYSSKGVANFFLTDFLGCVLAEEPQIQTKSFFELTQKYINTIASSQSRAGLLTHLLSEMMDQRSILNPTEFARRILDPEHRDNYLNYLRVEGGPVTAFTKNLDLIKGKLHKIQYNFASGVTVIGSPEDMDVHTNVRDLEDGKTRMEIIDVLNKVKTK